MLVKFYIKKGVHVIDNHTHFNKQSDIQGVRFLIILVKLYIKKGVRVIENYTHFNK